MPFALNDLLEKYPFAYHVTARENLNALRRGGRLRCTTSLLTEGNRRDLLQTRRRGQTHLEIGSGRVVIRDQEPLMPGALELTDGSTLDDYIEYLNGLVYLWPGTVKGPKGNASSLASVERAAPSVWLRFSISTLLLANSGVELRFSRYNAGAARHHPVLGKAKRRIGFHQSASSFDWSVRDVREMVVKWEVALPPDTSFANVVDGPWTPLCPVGVAGDVVPT